MSGTQRNAGENTPANSSPEAASPPPPPPPEPTRFPQQLQQQSQQPAPLSREKTYTILVAEKIKAGLPKHHAEEAAKAQLEHDAKLAAAARK